MDEETEQNPFYELTKVLVGLVKTPRENLCFNLLVTCCFCKNGIIIGHSFSGTIVSSLYQTEKSKNNEIERLFCSYGALEKKSHLPAKLICLFINLKKTPILIV